MKYAITTIFGFAEYVRKHEGSIRDLWDEYLQKNKSENQRTGEFYNQMIKLSCDLCNTNPSLFHSSLKFGNLPTARQIVVFTLSRLKMKNKEIARELGWLEPRISNLLQKARERHEFDNSFSVVANQHYELVKSDILNMIEDE